MFYFINNHDGGGMENLMIVFCDGLNNKRNTF